MIQDANPMSQAEATSEAASTTDAAAGLTFRWDDRHWRVRGLEKQLSCARLRVNLLVSRRELVHLDTLDLYVARQRHTFIKQAAAELYVEEATIKRDLGRVLLELEAQQEALIREKLGPRASDVPVMTDQQRQEALELLQDPQLIARIQSDFDACGLVGEETNRLVCYLACVSRLMARPLAVLIQSSSGAGKTTLQDATLRFMPAEQQVRLSAMTGQSLYYMGRTALQHKILAVAEEQGVAEAAYALKLLQSEGRLSIATAEKNADSGRQQTRLYTLEGPVAMLLTTTAEDPDPELASRCLVLRTNEQPAQTAAINHCQRAAYRPQAALSSGLASATRQQNAQRLLAPYAVVIPWAERLTFRTDQIRARRDNAKYLALIASITLLHQYQRQQVTRSIDGTQQACVIATLDDLEVANRLAGATLGTGRQVLLPQTRHLLEQLAEYVTRRAAAQPCAPAAVRFTQREVRESLAWSDRTLRRHLTRLVELEYVAVYRTGCGNQRAYQLLDEHATDTDAAAPLGLIDVRQLRDPSIPRRG